MNVPAKLGKGVDSVPTSEGLIPEVWVGLGNTILTSTSHESVQVVFGMARV